MTEQPKTLLATVRGLILKALGGTPVPGPYQPTDKDYLPNHYMFPIPGQQYGASMQSMENIRGAEEFSIGVKRLSEAVSAAEWELLDLAGNPLRKNNPAAELLLHPNPLQNWTNFIETAVYHLIPTGNVFILKNPISMAGTPLALWLLRPDRTRPIRNDQPAAPLLGYEHYGEDGIRYVFKPEDVIHIKTANPFTPYLGLGASQMIAATLAMDAASLAYNSAFFTQGGELGTTIEVPGKLDPESWKEMQQKIQESYMGAQNAHRVMILTDGAKESAASQSKSPKELDFIATRKDISRIVGAILGVTPFHMGHIGDANRATSVTQDQMFYRNGVRPLMRRLGAGLSDVVGLFGQIKFEFKTVEVEDPDVISKAIMQTSPTGALSPNDVREMLGQERLKGDPNMDKHFVANTQISLEDLAAKSAADLAAAAPDVQAVGPDGLPMPLPVKVAPPKPVEVPVGTGSNGGDDAEIDGEGVHLAIKSAADGKFPEGTKLQRRVLKFMKSKRGRTEGKMTTVLRRWLMAVGEKAAKTVEAMPSVRSLTERAAVWPAIAKVYEPDATDLNAAFNPIIKAELDASYLELADMFNVAPEDQAFVYGSGPYTMAVQKLAQRVTNVSDNVKEDLDALIRDGMNKGLSPAEIANGTADGSFKGIREVFEGMAQERAMLIARTETVALQQEASVANYKEMGVKVVDVIGCEDFVIMPGELYGCNSLGIPIEDADIEFHPNHLGAIVPRIDETALSFKTKAKLLALR